jgi:hypothetical protein
MSQDLKQTVKLDPYAERDKERPWMLWVVVGSVVFHGLALWLLAPWIQSQMLFDEEEERERAAVVAERQKERQELEHEKRQKLELPKEQAEDLKKKEERKRIRTLRDNVERLKEARKKAIEKREEALERVRERELKELLPEQIERVEQEMHKARHAAHQVSREGKVKEEAQEMKDRLKELDEKIEEHKKEAVEAETNEEAAKVQKEFQETMKEVQEVAEAFRERYEEIEEDGHGSLASRSRQAKNKMTDLAEEAEAQHGGVDTDEINDTSVLGEVADAPAAASDPAATPGELYEAATELEQQVNRADADARAAERALLHGTSVAEERGSLETPGTERPDLSEQLAKGEGEPGSEAGIDTVGDLNEFREAIATAERETTEMARSAERKTDGAAAPTSASQLAKGEGAEAARQEALAQRSRVGRREKRTVVNMVPLQMANSGSIETAGVDMDLKAAGPGGGEMIGGSGREGTVRLRGKQVAANALPGRMLTESSAREGFLYLDTWYFIGPWNNWARADFEITHPPEQRIDLDAVYEDGKRGPVRWQFLQSDKIAIEPPGRMDYGATYYAYTEVYSDKTREMLIAVASDDMAKVWLNGDVIWTDVGQSGWNLDEGFRKVLFHEGFNRVLVRVENGPTYCAFSVLLCPPEIVETE